MYRILHIPSSDYICIPSFTGCGSIASSNELEKGIFKTKKQAETIKQAMHLKFWFFDLLKEISCPTHYLFEEHYIEEFTVIEEDE